MEVHRIGTEMHLETGHAYLRSLTNGRTRQVQLTAEMNGSECYERQSDGESH